MINKGKSSDDRLFVRLDNIHWAYLEFLSENQEDSNVSNIIRRLLSNCMSLHELGLNMYEKSTIIKIKKLL